MTRSSKSGFSLLEVLVSLLILTVGVLAVARSMATMNRATVAGSVLTRAAVVGTSQLETLVARGCLAPTPGMFSAHGIKVQWFATSAPGQIRWDVIVQYPLDHAHRVDSLTYVLSCLDAA